MQIVVVRSLRAGPRPSGAAPPRPQEVPGTSWADPDLQGIWVASTLTPLERPSE